MNDFSFNYSNFISHVKNVFTNNTFLENIINKQQIQIFGNGENTRNFVYVDDVAELLSYSLKSKNNSTL